VKEGGVEAPPQADDEAELRANEPDDLDEDGVAQLVEPDQARLKPRMDGVVFTQIPPRFKGTEIASACCLM
jgi:hypothetical protein